VASLTNRIIWWSLVVANLIYAVVAHVVAPERSEVADSSANTLLVPLALTALATAVGTIILRRRALVGPIQAGVLDPATPAGREKAYTPFILSLVLSQSVGIYGLVLAFVSGNGTYSLPFIIGSLALLYVHRPTAPELEPPAVAGRPIR
jgi:hypothetical protein